eukprot:5865502-Pleurochrysis_carterae.AAC.1
MLQGLPPSSGWLCQGPPCCCAAMLQASIQPYGDGYLNPYPLDRGDDQSFFVKSLTDLTKTHPCR